MENLVKKTPIVLGLLLFIAIFPLPYGYYTFLRLIVFVFSLFLAYQLREKNCSNWIIFLIFMAILFNPLIPVYLSKEIWVLIDLFSATLFLILGAQKELL